MSRNHPEVSRPLAKQGLELAQFYANWGGLITTTHPFPVGKKSLQSGAKNPKAFTSLACARWQTRTAGHIFSTWQGGNLQDLETFFSSWSKA